MNTKNKNCKKIVILLVAAVLLIGGTIGGTLAWLKTTSGPVTNTFVAGNIGTLTLDETPVNQVDGKNNYVIIPGAPISKDPNVTYTSAEGISNIGDVYVFVEVSGGSWTYDDNTKKFTANELSWTVDDDWTYLSGKVFYIKTSSLTKQPIIKNNAIGVASTITEATMSDAVTAASGLTFTAYAIQAAGLDDATTAWDAVR